MLNFDILNPTPFFLHCADQLQHPDPDPNVYNTVRNDLYTCHRMVSTMVDERLKAIYSHAIHLLLDSPIIARNLVARYIISQDPTGNIFPFNIKNEAGVVTNKRYFPTSNQFDYKKNNPAHSSKTAYIANIPVVFRENFVNNNQTIRHIMDGFKDQTFGATSSVSRAKAPTRTAVILGANRFKSIEKTKNQAFKYYVSSIQPDAHIHMSTVGFLWEPKWVYINRECTLRQVRNYYTLLKRLDPELAERCRVLREEPIEGINDRVPYQQIRETIKDAEPTMRAVQMFRNLNPMRNVYLAFMDPDFIRLNNDGAGLFSHYNRRIKLHLRQHGVIPAVASTGYQAEDAVPSVLRYGVLLDMRVREAVSHIMPLAVYFPEPNFIVSVPQGFPTVPESFINHASTNQESRQIIAHLLRNRNIPPVVALAFQSMGAITTEMPDRFYTDTIKYNIIGNNIGQLKVLKALAGTRQSIVCAIWGWAMSVEKVISIKGPTVRGLMSEIYGVFNPIKLCKCKIFDLTSKYAASRHFELMLEHYEAYADIMTGITDELCDFYRRDWENILALSTTDFTFDPTMDLNYFLTHSNVAPLLEEVSERCNFPGALEAFYVQIGHLVYAWNGLLKSELHPDEFGQIIQASIVSGSAIYRTLSEIKTGVIH